MAKLFVLARIIISCIALTGCLTPNAFAAKEVEVLHWWTSGSEAKAVNILKMMMRQQGIQWKDFAVPGGAGESAMTVLKSRAISGNPPAAAQIKGPALQEWASLGFLSNLDDVAQAQHWDQLIPKPIARIMKYHGHYIAVPVNIHRTNWLWINRKIFAAVHAQAPTTWPEFFQVAKKLKAAGYVVLAQGNQDWQNTTLFESIALTTLGKQGYRQAFIALDPKTLDSPKMVQAFELFQKLRPYLQSPDAGQAWNQATAEVINNKAAMQITGDWANGEFLAAGPKVTNNIDCVPVPGTQGDFIYSVDSFAMFQLSEPADIGAQRALARTIMSKTFQRRFNQIKGSIPIRPHLSMQGFDDCSRKAHRAFAKSLADKSLLPSVAHGMATTSYVQSAILDVVNHFINDPSAKPQQAAARLMRVVLAAS
ncbi:ABC transporter substrate-binding protein [Celerinatantimonas yamalensis]|uniref:Probable sugar-binding periplasmic protein n=1 Tax=Celerinatantimonas yamalensis TaxID=559956 RepID=A0ABW9G8E1_9GAMM